MCDSVWPHRRQPTRLPHPWDSPGKNTGVDCHFPLQCMKVKSERKVALSCPTLQEPMICSLPGSSIHGIFQARVLEWGAITFSSHPSRSTQIHNLYYWDSERNGLPGKIKRKINKTYASTIHIHVKSLRQEACWSGKFCKLKKKRKTLRNLNITFFL